MSCFNSVFNIPSLKTFVENLPKTTIAAKKLVGRDKDPFAKYASCPECDSIYPLESCKIIQSDKTVSSRKCSFVKYPNHPLATQRQPCNAQLLKRVRSPAGTTTLYPRRMYCYQSLVDALELLIKRLGFVEKCELWRLRKADECTLSDIYDGRVRKEFQNVDGMPFLATPYNFGLVLNIDWFQPFKYSTYSAGAVYIAILNLPRTERENVILSAVIPGPKEPKKVMNSY